MSSQGADLLMAHRRRLFLNTDPILGHRLEDELYYTEANTGSCSMNTWYYCCSPLIEYDTKPHKIKCIVTLGEKRGVDRVDKRHTRDTRYNHPMLFRCRATVAQHRNNIGWISPVYWIAINSHHLDEGIMLLITIQHNKSIHNNNSSFISSKWNSSSRKGYILLT